MKLSDDAKILMKELKRSKKMQIKIDNIAAKSLKAFVMKISFGKLKMCNDCTFNVYIGKGSENKYGLKLIECCLLHPNFYDKNCKFKITKIK